MHCWLLGSRYLTALLVTLFECHHKQVHHSCPQLLNCYRGQFSLQMRPQECLSPGTHSRTKGNEWKMAFYIYIYLYSGNYEYWTMHFGLTNASAIFLEHAECLFFAYLDDILIFSKFKQEHMQCVLVILFEDLLSIKRWLYSISPRCCCPRLVPEMAHGGNTCSGEKCINCAEKKKVKFTKFFFQELKWNLGTFPNRSLQFVVDIDGCGLSAVPLQLVFF